jgi:small-conductance mechanosensitive channel
MRHLESPWTRSLRFLPLVLGLLLLAPLAAPTQAQDAVAVDWSGTWETRWRGGGARVILQHDGSTVSGTYPLFGGRIEADATGRVLSGRWVQENRTGGFVFVQAQDGQSFSGRFDTGEWWTGARAATVSADDAPVDRSSPMATMRSFLAAANEAADGNPDVLGRAASLVFSPDGRDDPIARFEQTRALHAVIDLTTFRIWDLPHEAADGGDAVVVELEQAGTGETVTIPFRRVGGDWFIVPLALDRLAETADRMRDARARATADLMAGPGAQSPRDAMRDFLLGFGYRPDGTAAQTRATLDLRGRPEITRDHDGQLLAGYLKRVIDRAGYVIWQELPDDPLSDTPYVHFQHPEGNIVIAPVETETGTTWQFTPETLQTIRAVYTAMEDMPIAAGLTALPEDDQHFAIRRLLRGAAPSMLLPLGPFERWQWAGLVLTVIAMAGASGLVSLSRRLLARRMRDDVAAPGPAGGGVVIWALRGIATGVVLFGGSWLLGLPEGATLVLVGIAAILVVFGVFLLGWHLIGRLADSYRTAERITGHNLILLSLTTGVLRGVLLIGAVLILADQLSIPLVGMLAGFGIGGIAFALAAQPTLQNLLSGFTIYADRPLSVGDFCRFGDKMGTVEEIGLRSTRLRTLDRTVVSVPNSQFLDMELENFARRDRFLFTTMLGLRYETTPDQLRFVLVELRKLLIAHPMVVAEPMRVRFAGFGAHSLDVEVFSYVLASDMDSFAAIREDLLLRIMATVDAAGTQFAFPSVTHYAAVDDEPDHARVAEAEAAVQDWRASGDLPFPDFEWQSKAELSGSLDYPPEGSVLRRDDGAD